MKRLLWIGLVAALLLPGAAMASGRGLLRGTETENATESAPHLLWDIPFGTPAAEVRALVKEKTGLTLEEGTDQWGNDALMTAQEPRVEMLGYPARLSFSMDAEGRLRFILVYLQRVMDGSATMSADIAPEVGLEEGAYYLLQEYDADVHQAVMRRYGSPEAGRLVLEDGSGGDRMHDYPGGADGLDIRSLAEVVAEAGDCVLIARYGNVHEIAMVLVEETGWVSDPQLSVQVFALLLISGDPEVFRETISNAEMSGFTAPNGPYPVQRGE